MLLLVTIGLVLIGAVSLVIGFVSNSLPPIYLSIACSVIAGIVLVVFSRMSKRQEAGGPSATGFSPAASSARWSPPPSPDAPPPVPSYRAPAAPPTNESTLVAAPAGSVGSAAAAPAVAVEDFPLEGYDTLRVSQILPALDDLDLDDLDIVREREEQGKNRTTVLRRIDALMDEREAEEAPVADAPTALVPEDDDEDMDDEEGLEAEVEDNFIDAVADVDDDDVVPDSDMEGAADEGTAVVAADRSDDSSFPIPDYDRLPVAQILPLLDDLDDDELDMVAEREEQGKNRAAILDRIDDMFEPLEDEAPPPAPVPVPPAKPSPAKKAPVAKVTARKAPATKAPARKAPATKAPVKKASVKKAPVKKAPVKATPTKAGPVKRTAIKKAAAKKAAPVKQPSPVTRTATKRNVAAKRPPVAVKKVAKKR